MLHLDHAYQKINNTFIDNTEDLYIAMPMSNLLEYSGNYSMTSGSLLNYYRYKINDDRNGNTNNDRINNNKTATSKSFKYKTKLIGSTPNKNNILDAEVVVPLKYLSVFGDLLICHWFNYEINLDLRWSKNCVISEISKAFRAVDPNAHLVAHEVERTTIWATSQINNANLRSICCSICKW